MKRGDPLNNTLAIAALHALSSVPHQNPNAPKKTVHFPCNTSYDFRLLVDMYGDRLRENPIEHERVENKNESWYLFPNGGSIHIFVKEE